MGTHGVAHSKWRSITLLPKGVLKIGPEESIPVNLHTLGEVIIKSILHDDVLWMPKGRQLGQQEVLECLGSGPSSAPD